jgi:hypothetical protein
LDKEERMDSPEKRKCKCGQEVTFHCLSASAEVTFPRTQFTVEGKGGKSEARDICPGCDKMLTLESTIKVH